MLQLMTSDVYMMIKILFEMFFHIRIHLPSDTSTCVDIYLLQMRVAFHRFYLLGVSTKREIWWPRGPFHAASSPNPMPPMKKWKIADTLSKESFWIEMWLWCYIREHLNTLSRGKNSKQEKDIACEQKRTSLSF